MNWCRSFVRILIATVLGGLAAGGSGYVLGYFAGSLNESLLTGDALEDLHIGFAEFGARGLSFFGALVCALVGGSSGLIGAIIASVRKHAWTGILASSLIVVLVLLMSGLMTGTKGHWYEHQIVFSLGSVSGSVVAVITTRLLQTRNRL
jgi:hypothetical protein